MRYLVLFCVVVTVASCFGGGAPIIGGDVVYPNCNADGTRRLYCGPYTDTHACFEKYSEKKNPQYAVNTKLIYNGEGDEVCGGVCVLRNDAYVANSPCTPTNNP